MSEIEGFWKQKRASKRAVTSELGIKTAAPLLGIFLDTEIPKDKEEILEKILDGLHAININVVILTDSNLEELQMQNVKIMEYSRANRKILLEAADMSLGFDFSDLEEMLIHGTIPITAARKEVQNYDPNSETGNAFIYDVDNEWGVFAAVVRAVETFKFTYDWKHIVRQGIESVCGEVSKKRSKSMNAR